VIAESALPDPLTPEEAAAEARVPYKTVVSWCQRGLLPAFQLGGPGGLWRIPRAGWDVFKKWNAAAQKMDRRSKAVPGRSRQAAADRILEGV
jgi:excisionase family DNA binding protein